MKSRETHVMGVYAPPTRPTAYAAFCVAVVLALPVGAILSIIEFLFL